MTHRRPSMSRPSGVPARAFTLVELVVAIAIILILVGLLAAVGNRAIDMQRESTTKGLLVSLDKALEEYRLVKNGFPKYNPDNYRGIPGDDWEVGDSANGAANMPAFVQITSSAVPEPRKPSAGVFMQQARGVGQCDSILSAIPTSLMRPTPKAAAHGTASPRDPNANTVLDSWSNEAWFQTPGLPASQQTYIIYVHPENRFAQELFGRCVNNRPYFMSAGRDRLFGFKNEGGPIAAGESPEAYKARIEDALKDNLYSYPAGAPNTTDDFFNSFR